MSSTKPDAIHIARQVLARDGDSDLTGITGSSIEWDQRECYPSIEGGDYWEGYVLVHFELDEDPNAFTVMLYLEGEDVTFALQEFAGDRSIIVGAAP